MKFPVIISLIGLMNFSSLQMFANAEDSDIDSKITQAITEETVRQVTDSVSSHRTQFQRVYSAVINSDVATMEQLSTELKDIGTDYFEEFSLLSASHDDYAVTESNIQRAQTGWQLMKVVAMEILAVYEERVALNAFISYRELQMGIPNTKKCDKITESIPEIVHIVRTQLVKTKEMVKAWAVQENADATDGVRSELVWDIEHYSYDLSDEMFFMDDFVDKVKSVCSEIRDSDSTGEDIRTKWFKKHSLFYYAAGGRTTATQTTTGITAATDSGPARSGTLTTIDGTLFSPVDLSLDDFRAEQAYYTLPGSFSSCPSDLDVDIEECASAGLKVGGTLCENKVIVGKWMGAPVGCFIEPGKKGVIQFNENPYGKNVGRFNSVCKQGFTTVPSDHVCPTALDVSKDDCVAAGLGVGGRLRHDEIVEGAYYWTPPGCFIEPERFGDIHWNNDINGVNDQRYTSVCRKGFYTIAPMHSSCPAHSGVTKDDCIAAGLALGGTLRRGKLLEGVWTHTPTGCFIEPGRNNNIHYNHRRRNVKNDGRYTSVCKLG